MMHDTEIHPVELGYLPSTFDSADGFFLPSTCRRCAASGCGPVHDSTADAHAFTWRGGPTFTTEHCCALCGCEWTDTWPLPYLFGTDAP